MSLAGFTYSLIMNLILCALPSIAKLKFKKEFEQLCFSSFEYILRRMLKTWSVAFDATIQKDAESCSVV